MFLQQASHAEHNKCQWMQSKKREKERVRGRNIGDSHDS